jgi:large subunit ribosomal protein L29
MKASDIRELRDAELGDKLEELQKQLFELRSQAVTEKLENSMAIKNIKRDIARVKTVLRAKELAGQAGD